MRERRRGDADPDVRVGITPARAGKTSSRSLHRPANRDHPRSYGKDEKYNPAIRPGEGSPPLVRERHMYQALKDKGFRITPARAGKTRDE